MISDPRSEFQIGNDGSRIKIKSTELGITGNNLIYQNFEAAGFMIRGFSVVYVQHARAVYWT